MEEVFNNFTDSHLIYNGESHFSKDTVDPIEDNGDFEINPYENLGRGSKGFYIKGNEVNWDSKLSTSLNALKCEYIIQDLHRKTKNNEKKIIYNLIHIRSIEPLINSII